MTDLAHITATELWRRMWDAFGITKSLHEDKVLEDFLFCYFVIRLQEPKFSGISVIFQYSPKEKIPSKTLHALQVSKKIFSYAFHKMLQVKVGGIYSDEYFQKTIDSSHVTIRGKTYDVATFIQTINTLKWRFDFIDWRQIKLLKETLSVDDTLRLMRVLSNFRKKGNCVCVFRKHLEKTLAKDMHKSIKEMKGIVEKLCNRKYVRLHPTFSDYLQKARGKAPNLDHDLLKSLTEMDNLAGPYLGERPLPFIEINGFVFASLWLLHLLILEDLFKKTESFYLQRGFSLDRFTEKILINDGFEVARNVKWIKLEPKIDNKSKLEVNLVAFSNGNLLLIQCKSYGEYRTASGLSKITRQAAFWRKVAEYLSRNPNLVVEKLRRYNPQLYNEIQGKGLRLIYPLLVTEVSDLGVLHGCRVINILKFLTEIFYIRTRNLWNRLIENEEAIAI